MNKTTMIVPLSVAVGLFAKAFPAVGDQALEEVVVTADRVRSELVAPARQITVIDRAELQLQLKTGHNLAGVLAKSIPGMAPATQTLTNFNQTLRGRNMLVLVDGIPLNTNRNVSRDLFNVHPDSIERIEILRGGNAIYGSGATGGVLSITTRKGGANAENQTQVGLSGTTSGGGSDSRDVRFSQSFAGALDNLDYAFNVSYEKAGANFDSDGDRIAPEPSQGDMFDADIVNFSTKLGREIAPDQRLQLSATYYNAEQDTDFASDPAVNTAPLRSVSAQAREGLVLDEQNQISNTLLSVDYTHASIFNSELHTQVYYRDYETRFYPVDGRTFSTWRQIAQTYLQSNILGGRITLETPLHALSQDTELVWGLDATRDESEMPVTTYDPQAFDESGGLVFLDTGDKTFMPELIHTSNAGFVQLRHRFNQSWALDTGLRYERTDVEFDDFTTLAQQVEANPQITRGGKLDYDAWLFNAGIVYTLNDQQEFYAAFNQGFELPDIGLQIRNAQPDFNLTSSDLSPIKTNNYELGWRGNWQTLNATFAVFRSTSKRGRVQTQDFGLTLQRKQERIVGAEATIDYSASKTWSAGGNISWLKGEEKAEGDESFQDMDGFRIPPVKVSAYLSYNPSPDWSNRLQAFYSASEDYRLQGQESFGRHEVDSYLTLDFVAQYRFYRSTIDFGIENLTNKDYFPLYSQLLRSNRNDSYVPARGRTLRIGYTYRW